MRKSVSRIIIITIILLLANINTTKAVSSDTSLQTLSISPSGTQLVQDEDNNKIYRARVDNEVTMVEITAIPNSPNATVKITGNTDLQVGTNRIDVIVTAENGETENYIIYVRRADTPIASENIVPNVQEGTNENNIEQPTENTPPIDALVPNDEIPENNTNETSNEIQTSNIENIEQNIEKVTSETSANENTKNKNIIILIILGIIIIIIIAIIILKKHNRK